MSEYTVTGNIMGGRYSPGDSALHSIGPALKIWAGVLMIAMASVSGPLTLAALTLVSLALLKWAGVGFGHIVGVLKNFIFFFLVLALFPAFLSEGTPVAMPAYIPFQVTWEGLAAGGAAVLRFVAMVLISMLLTRTIPPSALFDSIENMMPRRLARSGPVGDIFKAGLLSMQVIPYLFSEVEKFAAANREEWRDVKGVKKYAKMTGLVIPFLVHIFKNMEAIAKIVDAGSSNDGKEG